MADEKLKIMVSSTVYGSEHELDQIRYILEGFGYEVIMSKDGNIYVGIGKTPEQACLEAVDKCDIFFGIIFPRYGSGITHAEFERAISTDKPRFFIAHKYIEFTRKLMQQFMYDGKTRNAFEIKPTSVLDSLKVIDMYNIARHNWVQPFYNTSEVQVFLDAQFKDISARRAELDDRKK